MITLNFISPAQKEANRFQKNYSLVKGIMLSLVIALVVIVGLLLLTQALLQNKLKSLTLATQELTQQTEEEKSVDLGQTVRDFNKLLKNIEVVQAEYLPWTEILIETVTLVPSGIQLSSFTIQKGAASFSLTGKANTREDLLSLKKNLEDSDNFIEVQSPISNLLLKENINFELSGKIVFKPNL